MKQTKQAPTAIPWDVCSEKDIINGHLPIKNKDGFYIAYVNSFVESFGNGKHIANAEFIVRAVNNHASLLEALKKADSFFSSLDPEKDSSYTYQCLADTVKAITEAIQNAEEK